jgi:hypothetical protein
MNRILALSAAAAGVTASAGMISTASGASSTTEVVAGCAFSASATHATTADDIVQVAQPNSHCI